MVRERYKLFAGMGLKKSLGFLRKVEVPLIAA